MSDSCCGKTVDVAALEARQKRVLITVLAINAATFLMVVAAALMAGSSSLLSGGLDNLGDALTYAMSLAVVGASMTAKAKVAVFKGLSILWRQLQLLGLFLSSSLHVLANARRELRRAATTVL